MKFFFLIIISLLTLCVHGQIIQVVDAKTGRPVEGVALYSESISVQTNAKGEVDINRFSETEKIEFRHSSYLLYTTNKQKLVRQGGIVLLIQNPVRLNEVVVSANRWEQSKSEIPQSIVSIPAENIVQYNPQTTADLLASGNGVYIQKSQMGGGSPMIRGFSANRLLIVVDGIRMNNAIYRSGNLQNVISIDPNSLENTEIILGPGSVIYGSDALGGVMSFSTLNPKLNTHKEIETSGKLMTRYSSANFEKTGHATLNFGSEKWATLFSATYTDYDNLRMGSNAREEYLRKEYVRKNSFDGNDRIVKNNNELIQKYTAYSQFNLLSKFRYRPNEKTDVIFIANHSETSNIPRYDRLIVYRNNKLRYGNWHYGPQVWTMFTGKLKLITDYSFADRINVQIAYQNYAESRFDRKIDSPKQNGRKEKLSIYSVNLDMGKAFDSKNELFYGIESYYNQVNSTGTVSNLLDGETERIPSRYPDNSIYVSAAGYVSYKYKWFENLIFQAGTRYTYTWMNGEFSVADYGFPFDGFDLKNSALIGNIGFVWHPTESWQFNIDASTGFRSPNIDDVAKVFDSEPGNVVVPNPNLKPEYARNIEIDIIKKWPGKASIEVTGFYTKLKNAMVRREFMINGHDSIMYDGTLSKVEALVNADAADIYGGSFEVEYLFTANIRTRHNITITKGEDADGSPIRHAPPTFGSSHLIFENPKWYADLFINYNSKVAYEDLAPSEQDKPHLYAIDENGNPFSPAWWTLNLKGNYKATPQLTFSGGIENILDQGYRAYSSGIVAPGVNLILSAVYQF